MERETVLFIVGVSRFSVKGAGRFPLFHFSGGCATIKEKDDRLKGETLVIPFPEYPRPALRRDSFQNLNGFWRYAITEEEALPHA